MSEVEHASKCARFYRTLGWNPLPSRTDRKGPALPEYKKFWDESCPVDLYDKHGTPNIQLVCGAKWNLVVVDIDGYLGSIAWDKLIEDRPVPKTWVVTNQGVGKHLYFSVPPGVPEIKSRMIWGLWEPANIGNKKGRWYKHSCVEILGDQKLVIAPPSVHPESKGRYEFVKGFSPRDIPRPAEIPAWILVAPEVKSPECERPETVSVPVRMADVPRRRGNFSTSKDVLDRITDKVGLAVSWGLKLETGKSNQDGWVRCYRAGTQERNASAGISELTGQYWEDGEKQVSLFDLAVKLGRYSTWQDAKRDVESRLH